MCPKYLSYESYRNCSYMQSGQLPLGLKCCNQQSSQDSAPFLVGSKFVPHQHCFMMRSRQFLAMSVWSPLLLLAGNLWCGRSFVIWIPWFMWRMIFTSFPWALLTWFRVESSLVREWRRLKMIWIRVSILIWGFWYEEFYYSGILSFVSIRILGHVCDLVDY